MGIKAVHRLVKNTIDTFGSDVVLEVALERYGGK